MCLAIPVPLGRAEEARARAIELSPAGFEERRGAEEFELVFYVTPEAAGCLAEAFPGGAVQPVEPGWEDGWRRFHRPVRAGGLWIGPPWKRPAGAGSSVVIDPGRAFGTGAHPTTRLCVELLASGERGSLLDVGCGSGVLSIAAARLGYGPVVAVDDDPVAVESTRLNAASNGVDVAVSVLDAFVTELPAADVVVANILLGAVERLLPRVEARRAVTSGYLAGERPCVPGWCWADGREAEGWAADVFVRDPSCGAVAPERPRRSGTAPDGRGATPT